jgi:hypothetical protein
LADNLQILDGASASKTIRTTDTAGVHTPHHIIEDGGSAALGATTDAVVAAGAAGTVSAKLRRATQALEDLKSLIVLAAGSNHIGEVAAAGDVAHDGADAGNPVKTGGKAVSAEPAVVAASDRANFITDLVGKQIVLPYANPENFIRGTTGAITDTTSTELIAAQAAGVRSYITSITVTNSHATVGTFVKILDGSTIIWEGYAAAGGGGFSISLPVPLRGSTATAVNAQPVTTGANVIVSVAGYKGV